MSAMRVRLWATATRVSNFENVAVSEYAGNGSFECEALRSSLLLTQDEV